MKPLHTIRTRVSLLASLTVLLLVSFGNSASAADKGQSAVSWGCQPTGNAWTFTRVVGTETVVSGPYTATRTCPDGSRHSYTWTETSTYRKIQYVTVRELVSPSGGLCYPLLEVVEDELLEGSRTSYQGYACPGECCALTEQTITTECGPEYVLRAVKNTLPITCPNGSPGTRTKVILDYGRDLIETIHEHYEATGACPGTACQDVEYPGARTPYLSHSTMTTTDDCH